jgi:hypothetical protein
MTTKNEEENEETVAFDLRDQQRVVLFEGKVLKRSYTSMMSHSCTRVLVLLNDVLLICSIQSSGPSLLSSGAEKLRYEK